MNDSKTILVVDDDEAVRSLMSIFLAKFGHVAELAETGIGALNRLKEKMPDLILLDVQMPGIDGLETLRRIKAETAYNNIPVIMVSGFS